ncbi:hypothetical protein D9M70_553510 [compost metagenome]
MNVNFGLVDILFFLVAVGGIFLSAVYLVLLYELVELKKTGKAPEGFRYDKYYEVCGDVLFFVKLINNNWGGSVSSEFRLAFRRVRLCFLGAGVLVISSFIYFNFFLYKY